VAEAEASAGLTVEAVDVAALEVAEVARGVVVVRLVVVAEVVAGLPEVVVVGALAEPREEERL